MSPLGEKKEEKKRDEGRRFAINEGMDRFDLNQETRVTNGTILYLSFRWDFRPNS